VGWDGHRLTERLLGQTIAAFQPGLSEKGEKFKGKGSTQCGIAKARSVVFAH